MVTAAMRDGFAQPAQPRARQEGQQQSVSFEIREAGGASAAVLATGGEKSLTDRFQKADIGL